MYATGSRMAFPVTCPSCGKAFQLATDIYERKVAGKVVSIKCKQCQSGIRVDATVPGQVKVLGTTPAAAGTDSRRPPATSIHEDSGAMRARQPTLLGMTAPSSPSSTGETAEPLWAVDSGGAGEDRELNDEQIAREIASGKLAPSTLVWREGFGDWLEIANVPQLAQHLPGAKKPAGLPPRVGAKSSPLNPAPARPGSSPLNPTPAAKPASAPINPTPAAKSAPLNAPAAPQPSLPKSAPLPAKAPAPAPRATAAKAPEPRAPQRSAPLIDPPPPSKIDLGLEDDDDSTMIYRAPTDLVAQLEAEEKAAAHPPAPPPAAGRAAMTRPGSAPKAAAQPPAPPPPPPLPAAPAPRAAPPQPPKSAPKAPVPAAPVAPSLRSFEAEPEPPASDPLPAPTISAEPEPPLLSAQPFPVLSAPIAARPLDPSIPIKGLEFPPAPRMPQGALPPQDATAPFGAPTPGVTPTTAPPGMGMLAPNPFGALPNTTELDFPPQRSKLPYVIAGLLGAAAIAGIVAVFLTSKAAPPPVPVPVAVPAATATSPSLTAPTSTAGDTASPTPGAPDPIANPNGAPGATGSGNFSQMFAAGVESAQKTGGPVAADHPPFDADAARKAVAAQLTKVAACRDAGSPVGQTSAAITFEPSGKVSGVTVGAPFAGTSTGTCMVTAFKEVLVAPFSGAPATVSQIVSLR